MKKVLALILGTLLATTAFVSCNDKTPKKIEVSVAASEGNETTVIKNEETAKKEKLEGTEIKVSGLLEEPEIEATDDSFMSILQKYEQESKGVDNLSMKMDMDLTMSLMGQTMDMVMSADYEIDGKLAYMNMDVEIPSLGQAQTTETYMDMTNYIQYVSVEGDWYKTTMDDATIEALEKANGMANGMEMDFSVYSKYMTDGTVTETDYNGNDCYELSGIVDIDYMELIDTMNLDSFTGSLEEAGLPENFYEEIFKNLQPFVLVIGIDKDSYLPVYFSMDMTEMMDALMNAMYSNMGLDIDFEITNCSAFAEYGNYGKVDVTIPAAALNAEEIEVY